jgi:pilus assembly protein CpaB
MSGRTLVLFLVSIMIAVAAVIIVKNRTGSNASVKVLVATSNIDMGGFVRADKQLGWSDWQGDIAPSFITSETFKIEDFNGAVARRPIMAGEPVTAISVVRVNEGGFMSAVLAPGKRAVSIAVSPTSGNAGFVFPGDRVDLILTHRIPVQTGNKDVLASETFIQDVRILAVDQMLSNPENVAVVAKTLTIEVSPKQAEMVNVATNLGGISISLRSLATKTDTAAGTPEQPLVEEPAPTIAKVNDQASDFSTNTDVSKLMGEKNAVRTKVNVIHGSASEQIDFSKEAQ